MNENKNTTYKIIWAVAKAAALGKIFLALNTYIRNKQRLHVSNLSS